MRFVNTDRFSPVSKGNDKPFAGDLFHYKPQEVNDELVDECPIDVEWWREQDRRCREGYVVENAIEKGGDAIRDGIECRWDGDDCYLEDYDIWIRNKAVHLSGFHYWYLNFWPIYGKLKDENRKDIISPRFLDMDYLFFERMEMMLRLFKDDVECKARQKGFSEKLAAFLAWYYTFKPNSQLIIVGGTDADAQHTMDNVRRGLDLLVNTQFYKKRTKGGNSKDLLISKSNGSMVHSLTAKDNPQAVSRFTPTIIVYEETGKWKKGLPIKTKTFVDASTSAEGAKTGYAIFIGTGGDMEAGAEDLQKLTYNPKKYNILEFPNRHEDGVDHENLDKIGHFTPAWMFVLTDDDGNSLRKKSLEHLAKIEEEKSEDDKLTHRTQHPIFLSDVFKITKGMYFGKRRISLMNDRIAYLNSHREARVGFSADIEWVDPKAPWEGVELIPNENGVFEIFERPFTIDGKVPDNLYNGATDSYDRDEAETSSSKGCCSIMKGFYDIKQSHSNWVAKVKQRPSVDEGGAKKFYEMSAKLCMLYNAINLIEWSNIRIFDWYELHGLEHMLRERPYMVTSNWVQRPATSNRFGIDPQTKKYWLAALAEHLTPENIENIDDVEKLKYFCLYRLDAKYNCDETIAAALNIIALEEDKEIIVKAPQEEEEGWVGYKSMGQSFKLS